MQAIAEHTITERLYEGPKSLVVRALDGAEQRVVLKLLKAGLCSPHDVARIRHEYELLKSFDSPGIIAARAMIQDGETTGIVLEDFGGESLATYLARGRPSVRTAVAIAIELASALGYLHRRFVIHKDLNPHNVVIEPSSMRVKIIDFGISSRLSRAVSSISTPNVLEGTLAYLSPEQTGRMNRAIDHRADFYGLGATLYEALTGRPPFDTKDPVELLHSHIAKKPVPPIELVPDLPAPLSDLVLKLLSKTAEGRYKSAFGLKADLEECLRRLDETNAIASFPLGRGDRSDRFQIPQRLYGRDGDIALLEGAFERVAGESSREPARDRAHRYTPELLLVAGSSGIGKSAVIHEIHRSLVKNRGYFISGKFDQFKRDVPYSAIRDAFQELMRHLLAESETRIAAWKRELSAAFGAVGQVVADVIPEVELLVGKQPPIAALPSAESKNRFRRVFQDFVRVFTRKRPLVLFLDDLQWADSATLDLLSALLGDADAGRLLLIGSYRDNEVGADHPLSLTLAEIEKAGAHVTRIALGALPVESVTELVADTLAAPQAAVRALAELVHKRTQGNPFFINEFLTTLYRAELFEFEVATGRWAWDLAKIVAAPIPDQVVALVTARVKHLDEGAQHALQLGACIGSRFDLQTLATVLEKPIRETAAALMPALEEGLLLPVGEAYRSAEPPEASGADALLSWERTSFRFPHDRVQQAVYGSIAEATKRETHLRVGRLLWKEAGRAGDEGLFEILNHLNFAAEFVGEPHAKGRRNDVATQPKTERFAGPHPVELAKMNLRAGKKARASAAYGPAAAYFAFGIRSLPTQSFRTHHELAYELHLGEGECAYLTGNLEAAEKRFDVLLHEASTPVEKARVYKVKTALATNQGRPNEAVAAAVAGLKLLGVELSTRPGKLAVLLEIVKTKRALRGRHATELRAAPELVDPQKFMSLELLAVAQSGAFFVSTNLFVIIVLKMLQTTARYGNSAIAGTAYLGYGVIVGSALGDFKAGVEFGELGLWLNERYPEAREFDSKSLFAYGNILSHWRNPYRVGIPFVRKAYQAGLDNGDMNYAGYSVINLLTQLFAAGEPLDGILREADDFADFIRRARYAEVEDIFLVLKKTALALAGGTERPDRFDSEGYDEARHVEQMKGRALKTPIHWYYAFKTIVLFIHGFFDEARELAEIAHEDIDEVCFGHLQVAEHYLYHSLLLTEAYERSDEGARGRILGALKKNQKKLKKWADNAPDNYAHKYLLVEAERARIQNDGSSASKYYEEAIASAKKSGCTHDLAIALELAGKYHFASGLRTAGMAYLEQAKRMYGRWGARTKVAALLERYPALAEADGVRDGSSRFELDLTATATHAGSSGVFDLPTVIKATRALSSEIVLDRLLARMMLVVVESAGAERGALVLDKNGELCIEAEIDAEQRVTVQSTPIDESDRLALGIVHYVARTQEHVVLGDAALEKAFEADAYVAARKPKSVLCLPLVAQGSLKGVLYLENNLASGAFTADRLELLRVLSTQMAVSIENAYLYANLEAMVAQRSRQLEEAQARLVRLQKEATEAQMAGGFAHEMRNALASAKAFLGKVFNGEAATETSLCADNSDKLKELFFAVKDHGSEEEQARVTALLKTLNGNERRLDEVLRATRRSIDRALKFTHLTMEYARVGREQPGRDAVELRPLIEAILKESEDDFAAERIAIDLDVDAGPAWRGNEAHFYSILKNLIVNARDALVEKEGSEQRRIGVAFRGEPGSGAIVVRDNGVGILPEHRAAIFEPFFSTKPNTGTGLGLGVVQKLVTLYAGSIEVESEPGQGAAFTAKLPSADPLGTS